MITDNISFPQGPVFDPDTGLLAIEWFMWLQQMRSVLAALVLAFNNEQNRLLGVGPVGQDGQDGMDGIPGRNGRDGSDGITLIIPGQDGEDGGVGVPGQDGAIGATGATGATGAIGANGYTICGEDGADGEPGIPWSQAGALSLTINSTTITGGTAGRILFEAAGVLLSDSSNLTFDSTNKRITVGSGSSTNSGVTLGYYGASATFGMWSTSTATPSTSNYNIAGDVDSTYISCPTTSGSVYLQRAGSNILQSGGAAGRGLTITPGTAITDVAAISLTRTNNNSSVATGVKFTFNDTTSAATFKPFHVVGGAGSTDLFYITKQGVALLGAVAFASLPTGVAGMYAYVTDSNTTTWGATIAGSSTNKVLAFYNGTNWTVAGI